MICSDVGGLAEAIVPDPSGLLVPQKDVNALTQAMLQLAQERARCPEMARVGRAHIEKNFSSQRISAKTRGGVCCGLGAL